MLEHMERTDGLAAIYPSMMNSIFALMAMGHGPEDPLVWREIKELSRFEIEDDDTIRLQPCVSPGLGHVHRHGRPGRSGFASRIIRRW